MDEKMYLLRHKNKDVLHFCLKNEEVSYALINIENIKYLPLPLQRIINYASEFIQDTNDGSYIVNEEGCLLVDMWLSDREIPMNRDNINAYLEDTAMARKWMLDNHAFAFTDCYWIAGENEKTNWEELYISMNALESLYTVRNSGKLYHGCNSSLGGELEKFWFRGEDGKLKLCKLTNKQFDILNAREVIASLIYERLGYPHCHYQFVYDKQNEVIGCSCDAFTSEQEELITSFDLLESHNMTQQEDVYEKIIAYAVSLGADEQAVIDYLDLQTLVDYIITNRDRHQGNIGFIRDAVSMRVFRPAPVYDSGSSKSKEGAYPEDVFNTTVNALYTTELECLEHVKNVMILDTTKLPSRDEIRSIFEECISISQRRMEQLLDLYQKKIEYIRLVQQQVKSGASAKEIFRKDREQWKHTI